MGFGKNLKKILDERGLTVYWLSSVTGISRTTIYSIIQNDNFPKMDTAKEIADKLGVSIYELEGVPFMDKFKKEQRSKQETEILSYFNKLSATDRTRIFSFISSQHLRDTVRRYCNKHKKTPYIKIHAFRHSHVALLINQGVDIMTISQRLGHAKPTITMNIYGHLYPDKQKSVADLLETLPR